MRRPGPTWLPFAAISAMAALGAGCSACTLGPPPCGRAPAPVPEWPAPEPLRFSGEQVVRVLELDVTSSGCSGDPPPEVSRVAVEVKDPRNLPVAAVASAPERFEGSGRTLWRTTVAVRAARVSLLPSGSGGAPAWRAHAGVLAQGQGAVWVSLDARSLRRLPADPRGGEVTLTPPEGWITAPDAPLPASRGELPLLFPRSGAGVDHGRALVPRVSGGEVQLLYFEARSGARFESAAFGLLHARDGQAHDFYRLDPP